MATSVVSSSVVSLGRFVSLLSISKTAKRVTEIARNMSSTVPGTKDLVITEKQGTVFLIGINRPEKRNCVNNATATQLVHAFKEFEKDESALVAVLYGKGGNFCAGYDLDEVAKGEFNFDMSEFQAPMGPSHMLTNKPIIAAVSGYAVAGGMELSLLCDLRVMEETAVMGVFCRRFGVPLIDGGTVRLSRLIGLSRAMDLILTGRPINAKEALEFGLANRVVACGSSLGQAFNLATCIAKFPQECLRADRRSAYYSMYDAESLKDALNYELSNGLPVVIKESVQGAKKFVEENIGKHGKFHLDVKL